MKRIAKITISLLVHDPDVHENYYHPATADSELTPQGLSPEDIQSLSDQMIDAILQKEGLIEVTRKELEP